MPEKKDKISIKKVLFAIVSLVMVVAFIWLFAAASGHAQEGKCTGIVLSLSENDIVAYVDTAKMRKVILTSKTLNPVGDSVKHLNMGILKQKIETMDWVKSAEIYLGNHNILNVRIIQMIPVARVFRKDGGSFYLVNNGDEIAANSAFAIKLPVFTGFPSEQNKRNDSVLLKQIKKVSKFIARNDFWKAQIAQININTGKEFELIPRVGDALILLGNGDGIGKKLHKLMIFYKKGLHNIGWGFYDTLDLRFDGQVVAVRKKKSGNPVVNALVRNNDPKSRELLEKRIQKKKL